MSVSTLSQQRDPGAPPDGQAITMRDGKPVSMRGVLVDVSARKRAEEELRASEKRLNAIIENAPSVAIQGFDSTGRVIFWNRAATSIFGWTAEEAIGKTLGELMLDAQGEQEWQESLARMAATGKPNEPQEWEFTARGPATELDFVSLEPESSANGPALDNIAVVSVSRPRSTSP